MLNAWAHTTPRGGERYSSLTVIDYPRMAPAPQRVCVLECAVPNIKKGDLIFAWATMQVSNKLAYAVEVGAILRLEKSTGGNAGPPLGMERGYNVVPQVFDFPGNGYVGPETFPGMHHGMLTTHGFIVAPEDAAQRYVALVAYAGGSSATVAGDSIVVDKLGQIDVLHLGVR